MLKRIERFFAGWTLRDWVSRMPPIIALLLITLAIFLFPGNTGAIGVATLLALLIAFMPYGLYSFWHRKLIIEIEEQLPAFLRSLVESRRAGMTLPQAIRAASKEDYGKLTQEIKRMTQQLGMGTGVSKVMKNFAKRLKESKLIQRSILIITEAERSGGDIVKTMETVASDATTIKEAEQEKKARVGQYVIIMYLIFFMFLGIAIALTELIPRMIPEVGGGPIGLFGGAFASPCKGYGGPYQFVCGFLGGVCKTFGFGPIQSPKCFYRSVFFSMIVIQAVFTGLIAGQIGEGSVIGGIKHSAIMLVAGFSVFIFATTFGIPLVIPGV